MSDARLISLTVNGETREVMVEPRKLVADVLREDFGLTGTHVGCEHGVCGACTVLIDDQPARACLTYAIQMEGHEITTIEAVGGIGLSPLQLAMHEEHGLQCGFCTPGFIMMTRKLLEQHPKPTEDEIKHYLTGNLCRCCTYTRIRSAIKRVDQA